MPKGITRRRQILKHLVVHSGAYFPRARFYADVAVINGRSRGLLYGITEDFAQTELETQPTTAFMTYLSLLSMARIQIETMK